jgi:hypothetical protein
MVAIQSLGPVQSAQVGRGTPAGPVARERMAFRIAYIWQKRLGGVLTVGIEDGQSAVLLALSNGHSDA